MWSNIMYYIRLIYTTHMDGMYVGALSARDLQAWNLHLSSQIFTHQVEWNAQLG